MENSQGPRRSARLQEKAQEIADLKRKNVSPAEQQIKTQRPSLKRKRATGAKGPSKRRDTRAKAPSKKEETTAVVSSAVQAQVAAESSRHQQGFSRKSRQPKTADPGKNIEVGRARHVSHWIENKQWPEEFFQFVSKFRVGREPRHSVSQPECQPPTHTERTMIDLYNAPQCVSFLNYKGCNLTNHWDGLPIEERDYFKNLLEQDCETPTGTAFDESAILFIKNIMSSSNETAVIRMISQLVVPSAELEISRGQLESIGLVDSIDEPWEGSISLAAEESNTPQTTPGPSIQPETGRDPLPIPQPDYALGFSATAFTREQLDRLAPFLGSDKETSAFKGTQGMLFPFLAVQLKSANGSLETAIRQNSHTMARALRGVIELFKMVGRQDELHRSALGVFIIHNHCEVEIYVNFARIENGQATYHYELLEGFSFTWEEGRNRWSSYKFVMAFYENWVPMHLERLRSAIDDLPVVNFDVSTQSPIQSKYSKRSDDSGRENSSSEDGVPASQGLRRPSLFSTIFSVVR
ncbi:uncharacterized protein KD926_004005 [Aspergillus affinis]|uniref:uncharacterized protein n=1 Tax=Aspergillus affinis TaxID=1070780 RepID=UPI0022FE565E|nr:uncharacterized protein KD926_004005 [Aspergillus affinis]KAI9046167.1 hypothetical protein KD926_004005 [Aspergillus affinis]